MASKNSIVHRVSLEGDADVKARLKSVEDAMKRLEATNASGGKGLGGAVEGPLKNAAEAGGKLRGVLAPVLTEINSLTSGLVDGVSGVFGKLKGALSSPLGVGIFAAARLQLARLGDETRRAELRIKALGGGGEGFAKLNASARTLGVGRDVLQSGLEQYLSDFSRNRRQLQILGGRGPARLVDFKPDVDEYLASQRSLFYGTRAGGVPTDQAKAAIEAFRAAITANGGLTSDTLAQLPAAMGNRIAQALSPLASGIGGFRDAGDLGRYLDEFGSIPEKGVNRLLAADESEAKAAADAARGVSDAFEGLRAATGRLAEAFGTRNNENIIKLIDSLAQAANGMADNAGKFGSGAGANTLGDVLGGKDGDLIGRLSTYIGNHLGDVADFAANGPKFLQETPEATLQKFMDTTAIGKFFTHAATNPGALRDARDESQVPVIPAAPAPAPTSAPAGPNDVWIADPNAPGGMRRTTIPTAAGSEMPAPPAPEIVPPQPLEQRSDASDSATQSLAALDGTASKTSASLDKFASDLALILDRLAGGAPVKAADGGLITGPGTSTSDSIPAMLSSHEYVMPAEATRAIGTNFLDTLRLPAQRGGLLSRMRRAARRFANGGVVFWRDEDFWKKHKKEIYFDDPEMEEQRNKYLFHHPLGDFEKKTFADLGPGDHQITYDPNSGGAIIDGINYGPEDPLLQDPIIKRELDASAASMGQDSASKSKFKSHFVGKFGGHVFGESGSYADGGVISGPGTGTSDSIPILASNGEQITNAKQAAKYRPLLNAINDGSESRIAQWMRAKYGTTMVSVPGFANGGIVGDVGSLTGAPVPDLPAFGPAASDHVGVDLRTDHGDFRVSAQPDVVRQMSNAARDSANAQIGRAPSWVYGRGR